MLTTDPSRSCPFISFDGSQRRDLIPNYHLARKSREGCASGALFMLVKTTGSAICHACQIPVDAMPDIGIVHSVSMASANTRIRIIIWLGKVVQAVPPVPIQVCTA